MPHIDTAYRFALGLTRSPDDAQDLVQEAMLRAFRGLDALRGAEAKSWLLTIVRNCYFTARVQQQRRAAVPLHDDEEGGIADTFIASTPGPEAASIRDDQQRALGSLLSRLSDEHREVLVLREIEDLSYREIATATRVRVGTVMSRLARARVALKELWLASHGAQAT